MDDALEPQKIRVKRSLIPKIFPFSLWTNSKNEAICTQKITRLHLKQQQKKHVI